MSREDIGTAPGVMFKNGIEINGDFRSNKRQMEN